MDQVTVANVQYKETSVFELTLDLYYPPGFDFATPAPAVMFVNGIGDPNLRGWIGSDLKETSAYISWGQLVAASGLVAINYQTGYEPLRDTLDLLAFLAVNADWLGLDMDHFCLWSSSSNVPVALDILASKEADYQAGLKCAVVYYGDTKRTSYLPPALALLVVKAGHDTREVNTGLDNLVAAAEEAGLDVELIEYVEGGHAFDIYQDTNETRDIVQRTLLFIQESLAAR
jgi:hypothetical protein